jgi:phosphoribosylglycinamide formyltransferase-1
MTATLRVACLLSGGGRSVVNLHRELSRRHLPATIVLAASTRPGAPGLRAAAEAGVPTREISPEPAATLDDRVDAALAEAGAELVVLAGYLRLFRVTRWRGRCINIHPSLLPRHGGRGMWGDRVHEAVIAAGDRESGCTVHWVDEQYDRGPAIMQLRCPVDAGMPPRELARRVFALECLALPEAVARIAGGLRHGESPLSFEHGTEPGVPG